MLFRSRDVAAFRFFVRSVGSTACKCTENQQKGQRKTENMPGKGFCVQWGDPPLDLLTGIIWGIKEKCDFSVVFCSRFWINSLVFPPIFR